MKIDIVFMGWIHTIKYVVIHLSLISYGKWYIKFSLPRIVLFYNSLVYVIKNTFRCYKCNKLIPAWQYASWTNSQGACCAQCGNNKGK